MISPNVHCAIEDVAAMIPAKPAAAVSGDSSGGHFAVN